MKKFDKLFGCESINFGSYNSVYDFKDHLRHTKNNTVDNSNYVWVKEMIELEVGDVVQINIVFFSGDIKVTLLEILDGWDVKVI